MKESSEVNTKESNEVNHVELVFVASKKLNTIIAHMILQKLYSNVGMAVYMLINV